MSVAKALCASAVGLLLLLLLSAIIAGATSFHSWYLVNMCYVAGFLVAAFALVAGVVGTVRGQPDTVWAALLALLVAIGCLVFVARFGYLAADLFKVSTEVVEEPDGAAGKPVDGAPGK